MAAPIEQHRWKIGDDDFACRVIVDDLGKVFGIEWPEDRKSPGAWMRFVGSVVRKSVGAVQSRNLIIEPGTQALLIDDGEYFGPLPAGHYTLESFLERLQFWRGKQATVILTRMEDQVLDIKPEGSEGLSDSATGFKGLSGIPTVENLFVDVHVRLTVQMSDVAAFLHNYMGTGSDISVEKLQKDITPLVRQALWSSIGRLSISDLTGPDVHLQLEESIAELITASFQRYGLSFVEVQMVSIIHKKYDKHRKKKGKLWLKREGLERLSEADEIAAQEEMIGIRKLERNAELEALALNVKADAREERLSAIRRCNEGKRLLLDEGQDLQDALLEIGKRKLLRDEEVAQLNEEYQHGKENREAIRQHAVALLERTRQQEIYGLEVEIKHTARMQSLDHEIELAGRTASRDNEAWKQNLQQMRQQAELDHEKQRKKQQQFADLQQFRRDDSWELQLHAQKMDRLKGEIEGDRIERQNRIKFQAAELDTRLAAEKAQAERHRQQLHREQKEWDLEHAERTETKKQDLDDRKEDKKLERLEQKTGMVLDRIERLKQINADTDAKAARLKLELENSRGDKAHEQEMARLDAMNRLGTEALIATAGKKNAKVLANLKKHESSQEAERLQAQLKNESGLNVERAKMYAKLSDAEKSKADAVATAYKEAMQTTQVNLNTALDAVTKSQQTNVVYPPAGSGPAHVGPPPATPPPPTGPIWHVDSR